MGDYLDDVSLGLLTVGLHDGQPQRRNPSHRIASLADYVRTGPEPFLYFVRASEQTGDGLEGELGYVETGLVCLLLAEEVLVSELSVDLSAGADESDSVDTGHHCLLDRLSLYVFRQFFGQLVDLLVSVLPGEVFSDHLDDHL